MKTQKMEYNELFGYISYESKDHGLCRLLDYADDWKLVSDEEKAQIRLAASAPVLLDACIMAHRILLQLNDHEDYTLRTINDLHAAIAQAEGR